MNIEKNKSGIDENYLKDGEDDKKLFDQEVFYKLIRHAVSKKKYDIIYQYIELYSDNEYIYYKYDCNLYLLLLSRICELPDKYLNYVKSISLDDVIIPIMSKCDKNIEIENDARILMMKQKLISASKKLKSLSNPYDDRIAIIKNLIHDAIVLQNDDKKKILNLVHEKKYYDIISYISNREKYTNLSLNDKYILILSQAYLEILNTKIIPQQVCMNTDKLFSAIDNKNYKLALSLSMIYSEKNNIPIRDNTIYLILNDICELILNLDENTNYNEISIDSILKNLENNNYENAFKKIEEYLILEKKEIYLFLVIDLLKIDILKKEFSFKNTIEILKNIVEEKYVFDASTYIFMYQNALINNEKDIALIYLDILNNCNRLVKESDNINMNKILSDTNIINYNKEFDFITEKMLDLEKGKHLIIVDNLNDDRIVDIKNIISEMSNIVYFDLDDNNSKKIVIRNKKKIDDNDLLFDDIIYEGLSSYKNSDYDGCINWYLKLFSYDDVDPFVYSRIGLSYLKKGDKTTAIDYLTVASYLNKKVDYNCDYSELICDLKSKKDNNCNRSVVDIDNYLGINNIEEVIYLVFQKDISIDDACNLLNIDVEKKYIIILLIARESFYQNNFILGDHYLKMISKVKNRSRKVDKLYKEIIKNRNFYKNRDDSNHKKLVLYKRTNI